MDRDWATIRTTCVAYEDDGVLVLDKPAGVSVTGERNDTDLMILAKSAREWLMPAHRIDKVTSGLVLLAKSTAVHGPLTQQFRDQSIDKSYLAVTRSTGLPERGTIELPLCVGRKNRVRVAASRGAIVHDEFARRWSVPDAEVREQHSPATTTFERLWVGDEHTLLIVKPRTGRRHQIRVHLAWIGHPILGDPLFGELPLGDHPLGDVGESRACLHSWRLGFDASYDDGRRIEVRADPPVEFWAPITPDAPKLSQLIASIAN